MKVLLVGATGDIGKAIKQELSKDTEIITASYSQSNINVDLASTESIQRMYQSIGKIDAVICAAARGVIFAPLAEMDLTKYISSLQCKLLGQIDLVIQGLSYLNDRGSFTLTTGLLNVDPIANGSAAAVVNSGIEGFVVAAAIDMPKQLRINAVSPALLTESKDRYGALFPGYETVSAEKVALAYRKSVYGKQSGKIYQVGW